jgi:hypothetical protein
MMREANGESWGGLMPPVALPGLARDQAPEVEGSYSKEGQQRNRIAACPKLVCHFEGDDGAEAIAPEEIGALGLAASDFVDVASGHPFDSSRDSGVGCHGAPVQNVERTFVREPPRQWRVSQDLTIQIVHEEDRRLRPLRTDRHKRGACAASSKEPRERRESRRLREHRSRERRPARLLPPGQECRRGQRIATELEEVVPRTDRPDTEDFLPKGRESALQRVSGREEGSLAAEGHASDVGQRAPI